MRCDECGAELHQQQKAYSWKDAFLGDLSLPELAILACTKCDNVYLPVATVQTMDRHEQEVLLSWLRRQPLSDFMSERETYTFLGISRQALHQHRQVERGMIFSTQLDGRRFFLRRSVEQFKATGDGRLRLAAPPDTPAPSKVPKAKRATPKKTAAAKAPAKPRATTPAVAAR